LAVPKDNLVVSPHLPLLSMNESFTFAVTCEND